MKKFVLRVLAVMMVAAMMIPSMGNAATAMAAEAVTLDLSERVLTVGDAPADNADGSITFSGQTSMKASFALPETLAAGESVKVNLKMQFNSEVDTGVRFYLIAGGTDVNTAAAIETVANEATGTVVEKTFTLTASADSTELLLASSGYGVYMDNVTILDITLGDKPAEAPAADLEALNIKEPVFTSGAAPTVNADGSVTFSGQASMKASFALPETLAAGDSVNVNVKVKFDSDVDTAVRFYLIAGGTDVNTATGIEMVNNEATGTVVEKSFVLTASADSTEVLLASSSYGVYIDNVTLYEITLGEKPVVEQPKADTPAVEQPKDDTPATEQPKDDTPVVVTGDTYVVKAGDTLSEIAMMHGVTTKALAAANNITNPDLIDIDVKLVIPAKEAAPVVGDNEYVVKAGDTLSEIALQFGLTTKELADKNNITNPDLIDVDQILVVK